MDVGGVGDEAVDSERIGYSGWREGGEVVEGGCDVAGKSGGRSVVSVVPVAAYLVSLAERRAFL